MQAGRIKLIAAGLAAAACVAPGTAAAAQTSLQTQADTQRVIAAAKAALARGEKPQKLRRATPAWYTSNVERRVQRRGWAPLPVDAPLPAYVGIRPGAWIISPYWCTANFVFQKRGTLALGTAGHCVDGNKPVVLVAVAPTGGAPVLIELGPVVLRMNAGIGQDYALVEIPASRRDWVFPTIAGVGGPCGVYTAMAPQPVAHYGHGTVVGTGGTPRAGMGIHVPNDPLKAELVWDNDSFAWIGLLAGGDSGSAVREGLFGAVGDLTHGIGLNVPGGDLPPSAIGWGTRVTRVTSKGWSVVNSPLCA